MELKPAEVAKEGQAPEPGTEIICEPHENWNVVGFAVSLASGCRWIYETTDENGRVTIRVPISPEEVTQAIEAHHQRNREARLKGLPSTWKPEEVDVSEKFL